MGEGHSVTIYLDEETKGMLDQMCKLDQRTRSNFFKFMIHREWGKRQGAAIPNGPRVFKPQAEKR